MSISGVVEFGFGEGFCNFISITQKIQSVIFYSIFDALVVDLFIKREFSAKTS